MRHRLKAKLVFLLTAVILSFGVSIASATVYSLQVKDANADVGAFAIVDVDTLWREPQGTGHSFDREKVRPVREKLHVHVVLPRPLDIGSQHREPFDDLFPISAGQPLEVIERESNDRHVSFLPLHQAGAARVYHVPSQCRFGRACGGPEAPDGA